MRGAWGWLFVALWLTAWWLKLDADHRMALTQPCPDSWPYKLEDFLLGKGQTCKAMIDSGFWGSLLLAALFSPLAFVFAHHFAHWRMAWASNARQRAAERQEQTRQQAHHHAMADLSAKTREQEAQARHGNDRYEIITRLGAVDDQLLVLADETDPDRVRLIKLNLAQALRDIHAKFRADELQALCAADPGIMQRARQTLTDMQHLNLADTRFYTDLASLFPAN